MIMYKVQLSSLGRIIQLPDSQKIYGAILHYLNDKGDLSGIEKILDSKLYISNVFPMEVLPNIYIWGEEYTSSIDDKMYEFSNNDYKDYKSKKYITLGSKKIEVEETFRDMNNTEEIVKGSGGVFSQNIINYKKEEDGKKEIINDFEFYFRCDSQDLSNTISTIIKEMKVLKLGKRSTRGMNLYEVIEIERLDIQDSSECYLNLGMLGMNNLEFIDMEKSKLKIYTSKRKGYVEWKKELIVQYIGEGSVICLKDNDINNLKSNIQIDGEEGRRLYTGGFLLPLRKKNRGNS
ncbi:MAG: hypothetical protein KTQ14_08905 [Fusobacteriaceae bacterium]|nr:hypothetical protein [Fusobacteriaceae bacterium]